MSNKKVVDTLGNGVGLLPTFIFANDILFCKDLYVIDCINESWNKFSTNEQDDILKMLSDIDYEFIRVENGFDLKFNNEEQLKAIGLNDAHRRFKMFKRGPFITKKIIDKYEDRIGLLEPESGKHCGDFGSTLFGLLNTTVDKVPFFFIYEEDDYGLEEFIINEMNKCNQFNIANMKELQEFLDLDKEPFTMLVNYVKVINENNIRYEDCEKLVNLKFSNNAHNYTILAKVGLEELITSII